MIFKYHSHNLKMSNDNHCYVHLESSSSFTIAHAPIISYIRHVIAALHFNKNLVRNERKKADGTTQLKYIYLTFKNGEATVRNVRVKPDFGKQIIII